MLVKLQHLVEAMEYPKDWLHYIHPQVGHLVTLTDEDLDPPEWRERKYFWSPQYFEDQDYIRVPDLFGQREWRRPTELQRSQYPPGRRPRVVYIGSGEANGPHPDDPWL